MSRSLFIICTSIILTGCFKYQYATVESNLHRNINSEFIVENDTFKMKYWFSGEYGPIHIEVFNKLPQPLYVDWKKSALIKGDHRYPFWQDVSSVDVYTKSISYGSRISGPTTGRIYRAEQISFIPSQSSIDVEKQSIQINSFKVSDTAHVNKIQIITTTGTESGKMVSFQKKNTPLKFRCFIALATTEDFSSPIFIDNEFWVSDVTSSLADPKNMLKKRANQFFVRDATAFGVGAVTVVGVAVLGVYIIGKH